MSIYKDKNRGTWFCKFRYTDWQGNRKETTKRGFATKKAAKEWEEEYIRKASGTSDMSLQSLYDIYYEDRKKQVKASTLYTLDNFTRTYILPTLGALPLSAITPNVIRNWQNSLTEYDKKHGGKLQESTILTINRRLSSILSFAVKFYGLPRNPMRIVGTQGKTSKRIDFWSKEEFDTFIRAVEHPIYKTLYILLFYSGIRIGEALALERGDLDGNRLSITKTRSLAGSVTPPKTKASIRTISLPAVAVDALNTLGQMLESRLMFPVSYESTKRYFRMGIKASGVRPLTIHSLRHAHASLLLANGVPVPAVSKRLGHTSASVTMEVYAHATKDSEDVILSTLDKL
jgi:integrase